MTPPQPSDPAGRLGLSPGMRNILTHEYGHNDLDLVAEAVPAARQDFGAYVRLVRDALIETTET